MATNWGSRGGGQQWAGRGGNQGRGRGNNRGRGRGGFGGGGQNQFRQDTPFRRGISQELTSVIQRNTDYFAYFWRGCPNQWYQDDGVGQNGFLGRRAAVYSQWPVPMNARSNEDAARLVRGRAPFPFRAEKTLVAQGLMQGDTFGGQSDEEVLQQVGRELQNGRHGVARLMRLSGWRFVRVLGKGTQGIAVLYEFDTGGQKRKVVVKFAESEIHGEIRAMTVSFTLDTRQRYESRCAPLLVSNNSLTIHTISKW